MLISSWFLFLKSYKWIFLIFTTCHCVPGRIVASRLSHRTRLLEDGNNNNFHTTSNNNIEPTRSQRFPTSYDIMKHYNFPANNMNNNNNNINNNINPNVRFHQPPSSTVDDNSFMKRFSKHDGVNGTPIDDMMDNDSNPTPSLYSGSSSAAAASGVPTSSMDSHDLYKPQPMYKQYQSRSSNELNLQQQQSNFRSNNICTAPDFRTGVCYDASECSERGGTPMGRCSSQGIGSVCCLFESTCGQSISESHVYFRNPGYPASFESPQICRTKVNKIHQSICQLKLNFRIFDIAKPMEGNCTQDIFAISGQNENNIVPRICGLNSGQHYYIAVDESGLINLQMVLRGLYPRKFDIHIEQIPCDSKDLAPPHCLQFYDGTQGTIKSFNYDYDELMVSNREMGPLNEGYPNNVDYLICLRKETGFCSVSYEFMSDHSGTVLPFSIGMTQAMVAAASTGTNFIIGDEGRISNGKPFHLTTTGQLSGHQNGCNDDYLIVGGMRLCSHVEELTDDNRAINSNNNSSSTTPSGDNNESITVNNDSVSGDSITSGADSGNEPTPNSPAPPSRETGELYEDSHDRISEVEGVETTLRRAHRRASLANYFEDTQHPHPQLHPNSGPRRRFKPSKRHQPPSGGHFARSSQNLMAIDSTPGPFQLRFVSNGNRNARGFYLAYRQNPCRI